jgi:hypothetical protein
MVDEGRRVCRNFGPHPTRAGARRPLPEGEAFSIKVVTGFTGYRGRCNGRMF